MDIVNFFETVEGTWFSQRTTHFAPGQPSQTGQTTLTITPIEHEAAKVAELCQQFEASLSAVAFAYVIQQEGKASTYGGGSSVPASTTLMVGLKPDEAAVGSFFSQTNQEPAIAGQYQLEDEVLTLRVQSGDFQSQERWWYMNPNLRMRTTLVEQGDDFRMASFCSEIRRMSQ